MSDPTRRFRVALTGDFFTADGSTKYPDIGLAIFEGQPHIEWTRFSEHQPSVAAGQVAGANGVIVLTPSVTAATVARNHDLLGVGRFGVGYDAVDVEACTQADVVVYITAGAVDRSVAEATVGWMIALSHHLRMKDMLVRTGGWDERSQYMGRELRDRTFGAIGLGGIGRAAVSLLRGFGMKKPLAFDPHLDAARAEDAGVRLVGLDDASGRGGFRFDSLSAHTRDPWPDGPS